MQYRNYTGIVTRNCHHISQCPLSLGIVETCTSHLLLQWWWKSSVALYTNQTAW